MYKDVLHAIGSRWNEAATDWDPEKFASLYAEDAVFYGGRQSHAIGKLQILEYFRSYSDELKSVQFALAEQEIREISPTAFATQGYGDANFGFVDGRRTRNRVRTSWVLSRHDDEWRIMLHHFSPTPEEPPFGS